jgi:vacuolar-type H+-ATPase subunit F/Vma7
MKSHMINRITLILGLSLMLSACVKVRDPWALVPCPSVGVLADASEITRFRYGGDRDISDIAFHGEITRVDFSCVKPEKRDIVFVRAEIYANFERGMAATTDRQFFNMFLAISEREDRVLDKSQFTFDVSFKDGARTASAKHVIKKIRVPTGGTIPAEQHTVFVGFQLSPVEVAYNRTKNKH